MNINFDPETQINIDIIHIALQLTSIHREVRRERKREATRYELPFFFSVAIFLLYLPFCVSLCVFGGCYKLHHLYLKGE